MTPDTITKVTATLARDVRTRGEARTAGAGLGRTLAAQVKARAIATEQINLAATTQIELSLLELAASADELMAEIADSALQELHHKPGRWS